MSFFCHYRTIKFCLKFVFLDKSSCTSLGSDTESISRSLGLTNVRLLSPGSTQSPPSTLVHTSENHINSTFTVEPNHSIRTRVRIEETCEDVDVCINDEKSDIETVPDVTIKSEITDESEIEAIDTSRNDSG